jgi:hypothetical protein
MKRPAIGTRVREGSREGVVVAHAGREGMVDVQFTDVAFVVRRDAARLVRQNPAPVDPARDQFRAVVEAVYERLVLEHTGKKTFLNERGTRADARLSGDTVRALLDRAFAIATAAGRRTGDVAQKGNAPTASGRALSALRAGADPRLVAGQLRRAGASPEGIQRVLRLAEGHEPWADVDAAYEQTLGRARKRRAPALRKVANPPLRRNFIAAAARGVATAARTGAAAIRSGASAARLAASEAGTAARVAAGEAKVVAGVAAGEVRAAAGVAGEATQKGVRAFLASDAGKKFVGQVTATAVTLFGAEVARRAALSPEQTKLLQATLQRKTGEDIDPELITAALRSKK